MAQCPYSEMVNHCQLKQTAFPYPTPTRAGEKYGTFTSALREIFPAATVSAGEENPQDTQENIAREGRLRLSTQPQTGQVRDVLRGSTSFITTPASFALYSIK